MICYIAPSSDATVDFVFPGLKTTSAYQHRTIGPPARSFKVAYFFEPALQFIAKSTNPFQVSALPGRFPDDFRLILVRDLIREHVLRPVLGENSSNNAPDDFHI